MNVNKQRDAEIEREVRLLELEGDLETTLQLLEEEETHSPHWDDPELAMIIEAVHWWHAALAHAEEAERAAADPDAADSELRVAQAAHAAGQCAIRSLDWAYTLQMTWGMGQRETPIVKLAVKVRKAEAMIWQSHKDEELLSVIERPPNEVLDHSGPRPWWYTHWWVRETLPFIEKELRECGEDIVTRMKPYVPR